METIFQLIQERQPVKVKSERGELIRFFVDKLKDKQGKPFPARRIAVALGHIPTKDIYYIISIFKDTEKRRGLVGASKEFWFNLKVK
jgi:hypothetical protein